MYKYSIIHGYVLNLSNSSCAFCSPMELRMKIGGYSSSCCEPSLGLLFLSDYLTWKDHMTILGTLCTLSPNVLLTSCKGGDTSTWRSFGHSANILSYTS